MGSEKRSIVGFQMLRLKVLVAPYSFLSIFCYFLSYMLSASGYIVPISDGLNGNKLVPILFFFRE